jgi:hypothetical protein
MLQLADTAKSPRNRARTDERLPARRRWTDQAIRLSLPAFKTQRRRHTDADRRVLDAEEMENLNSPLRVFRAALFSGIGRRRHRPHQRGQGNWQ